MAPFNSVVWPQGQIGIAFSAGKDSSALLALATTVYSNDQITAIHIDHQARAVESCRAECKAADELAQRLGVGLIRAKLAPDLKGESRWREERYRALAEIGLERKLDWVLTAHHARDQSETILLNLLRGSDLLGLKGMPKTFKRHGQKFMRPLLNCSPEKLYDYLESLSIAAFEDPSNASSKFKRNQLRHQILPQLEAFLPGCLERLSHLGPSIEKLITWQESSLKTLETDLTTETLNEFEVAYDRLKLQNLPEALLQLWCKSRLIERAEGASKITRFHIERLAQFISGDQLGYLSEVFPSNLQVRAQKRRVIFKQLGSN